jgi:hypothetical protein
VRAKNIYGFGPYSDVKAILAADTPSPPQVAITAVVALNTQITFTAPYDNGAAISRYTVEFKSND